MPVSFRRSGGSIRVVVLVLSMVMATIGGAAAQRQATPPWLIPVEAPPAKAEIEVGTTTVTVELAVTPSQQTLGLGYRNGLEPGTGMLFVNDRARPQTFWMKGMRFCLDIVWIENGEIVGAAENVCPDPAGTSDRDRARFSSPEAVTYVLEVPAGWLQENGYGRGTRVTIPATIHP